MVVVDEQKILEEGGELYGKTVYLFGGTERKYLSILGTQLFLKLILLPLILDTCFIMLIIFQ